MGFEVARTGGTTAAERALPFPGDRADDGARDLLWRGVDVGAPASLVFRWLCQLRVAPYSYDWIDNLGPRSPRSLVPGLEELGAGQTFMKIFRLLAFEPGVALTLETPPGSSAARRLRASWPARAQLCERVACRSARRERAASR